MALRQKQDEVAWASVVTEAMQRRKAKKMTQRHHATLAGVSVPTMAAFERGDLSLTLAKAFDILRVVDMVDESSSDHVQDRFVRDSIRIWHESVRHSGPDSDKPYYWMDYWLEGPVRILDHAGFARLVLRGLGKGGAAGAFWQASSEGRVFLLRSYQEDFVDGLAPCTVLDPVLPVRRMAEMVLHAAQLARHIQKKAGQGVVIHFRAHFGGLAGRRLQSMAHPLAAGQTRNLIAQAPEITLDGEIPVDDVPLKLSAHLSPMVECLYDVFGLEMMSEILVDEEIRRLTAG